MATAYECTRRAQPLLGTFVEITAGGPPPASREAAIEDAFAAIAAVHRLMSFFDADSDIGRINGHAGGAAVPVHAWTYEVLAAATDLQRRSGGLFDPCAGWWPPPRAASKSGFADDRSPCAESAIELLPERRVRLRQANARVDLGGIAKGFAVDRAIEILRAHGVVSAFVNAGGDLAVIGARDEAVEIRDPRDPRLPLCRIMLRQAALASSAGRFDPFRSARPMGCAVVDPRARRSTGTVAGASVLAPSCMIADALTKVALIAGPRARGVLQDFGAEALLVMRDGCRTTPGWPLDSRLAA